MYVDGPLIVGGELVHRRPARPAPPVAAERRAFEERRLAFSRLAARADEHARTTALRMIADDPEED